MTNNKGRKLQRTIFALCALMIVFIICFFVLKVMYNSQSAPLQSTWRSTETGQVLTFTHDEQVKFEGNLPNGIYHILSPNTIEYTVNGKTFQMFYEIDKNNLYWGIDPSHLECFVKVWW